MKNDKERKAFVDDDRNWAIVDSTNNMLIRMKMLEYGDMKWCRVDAFRQTERYDVRHRKLVTKKDWTTLDMYAFDELKGLGEHVSVTQIVNRIKDYDKEHREGK